MTNPPSDGPPTIIQTHPPSEDELGDILYDLGLGLGVQGGEPLGQPYFSLPRDEEDPIDLCRCGDWWGGADGVDQAEDVGDEGEEFVDQDEEGECDQGVDG